MSKDFWFLHLITTNGSGKATGYCCATYDIQKREITINSLVVYKEFRDCGYGSALIHGVLQYRNNLEETFRHRAMPVEIPVITIFDEANSKLLYLADKFNFKKNRAGIAYKNYKYDNPETDYFSVRSRVGFGLVQSGDKIFITDNYYRIICIANFFVYSVDDYDIFEERNTVQASKTSKILCIDGITFVDINCQHILSKGLSPYAIEFYIEAFMKVIRHLEAYAKSNNINNVMIFNGPTKRCVADETYNEILCPLGYRYKMKHRGFIKTL